MTLDEYIERSHKELDDFKKEYLEGHEKNPENFPLEMSYDDWGEQELAGRFQTFH